MPFPGIASKWAVYPSSCVKIKLSVGQERVGVDVRDLVSYTPRKPFTSEHCKSESTRRSLPWRPDLVIFRADLLGTLEILLPFLLWRGGNQAEGKKHGYVLGKFNNTPTTKVPLKLQILLQPFKPLTRSPTTCLALSIADMHWKISVECTSNLDMIE